MICHRSHRKADFSGTRWAQPPTSRAPLYCTHGWELPPQTAAGSPAVLCASLFTPRKLYVPGKARTAPRPQSPPTLGCRVGQTWSFTGSHTCDLRPCWALGSPILTTCLGGGWLSLCPLYRQANRGEGKWLAHVHPATGASLFKHGSSSRLSSEPRPLSPSVLWP